MKKTFKIATDRQELHFEDERENAIKKAKGLIASGEAELCKISQFNFSEKEIIEVNKTHVIYL